MRIVDLDKVRWKEGFYDMHTGEQYASMIFNTEEWLEWATAEAEVKAIPIEWIEKKLLSSQYKYEDDYDKGFDKGWNSALRALLRDWEKENE